MSLCLPRSTTTRPPPHALPIHALLLLEKGASRAPGEHGSGEGTGQGGTHRRPQARRRTTRRGPGRGRVVPSRGRAGAVGTAAAACAGETSRPDGPADGRGRTVPSAPATAASRTVSPRTSAVTRPGRGSGPDDSARRVRVRGPGRRRTRSRGGTARGRRGRGPDSRRLLRSAASTIRTAAPSNDRPSVGEVSSGSAAAVCGARSSTRAWCPRRHPGRWGSPTPCRTPGDREPARSSSWSSPTP